MYQNEHDDLFASIRVGQADQRRRIHGEEHADGDHGPDGHLHRTKITWEQAMNSKEDLSPSKYDWKMSLPEPPVAMPGKTKFV